MEVCQNLSFSEYMTPEIISIFVALLFHIPLYYILLVIIDVKSAGGKAKEAFSCFKVFNFRVNTAVAAII